MGEAWELRSGEYRARVDRTGAGLQELTWRGRDLVWPYTSDTGPDSFQGQLLAPWPNRTAAARYTFQGTEYRLEADDPATGAAIHGLVHALDWSAEQVSEEAAVLRLAFGGTAGYPFPLDLTAAYRLGPDGLDVTVGVRNTGTGDAPFGLGFHPYLTLDRPLWELSERGELTVSADAGTHQPTDGGMIPKGAPLPVDGGELDLRPPGRSLGSTVLDTAFTALDRDAEGRSWVRVGGPEHRVCLWSGPGLDWLQLYSGDTLEGPRRRAALAAEPMTCPPDALNSGTGLLVLAPGASAEYRFGLLAEPV